MSCKENLQNSTSGFAVSSLKFKLCENNYDYLRNVDLQMGLTYSDLGNR